MTTCIYKRGLGVFADKRAIGNFIDNNCSKIITVDDYLDGNEYIVIHSGLMISHDIIKRAINAYKNKEMGELPITVFAETLRPYLLLEDNSSTILFIIRGGGMETVYELICGKTGIQICDCNAEFYAFGSGGAMAQAIYTHSILDKYSNNRMYDSDDLFDDIINIFPTLNKLDQYTSESCTHFLFKDQSSYFPNLSDIPF